MNLVESVQEPLGLLAFMLLPTGHAQATVPGRLILLPLSELTTLDLCISVDFIVCVEA